MIAKRLRTKSFCTSDTTKGYKEKRKQHFIGHKISPSVGFKDLASLSKDNCEYVYSNFEYDYTHFAYSSRNVSLCFEINLVKMSRAVSH